MKYIAFATIALLFAACDKTNDKVKIDRDEPVLTIITPERGNMQSNQQVTVTGTAVDADSGLDTVVVNGQMADVNENGEFSVNIALEAGMNVITTTATDKEGNEAVDNRATLLGNFAQPGDKVEDALALRLNHATYDILSERMAGIVGGMDIETMLVNSSPIATDDSGCTKYDIYVDTFNYSSVEVSLDAADGGIDFAIQFNDLHITGQAHWKTLCILPRSWSDYTIVADWLRVSGHLAIGLDQAGDIEVDVVDAQTDTQNFDFDSNIILDFADWILNFENKLKDSIQSTLEEDLPPTVQELLRGFTEEQSFMLFGASVMVDIDPTIVDFDETGGVIVVDSKVNVGSAPIGYFRTPNELPIAATEASSSALQMTLEDDLLNQVLHGAWASGALVQTLPMAEDSPGSLGGLVDKITINPLIPPIFQTDLVTDTVTISVGDLLVDVIERNTGDVITRLAITIELTAGLESGPNGGLLLDPKDSKFAFSALKEGVQGSNILSEKEIESLVNALGSDVGWLVKTAVGEITLPSIQGTIIENPTFDTSDGHLQVRSDLTIDPTQQ